MATGDLIKLGGFYLDGALQTRPTRPWRTDVPPPGVSSVGNIPSYLGRYTIEIRDTPAADADKMQWIEVVRNNKRYLIADRVALVNVSWDDLNAQNLVFGKEIYIDGQKYNLRLLTAGTGRRVYDNPYSGGEPTANEWDQYIANELGLSGLPTPTAADLDSSQVAADLTSVHNQKWNWFCMYSWGQETDSANSANRAMRGMVSARMWDINNATSRQATSGWRPVLEVLNVPPTITPVTTPSGSYTTKPSFAYTVADVDGNAMTITEVIDGIVFNTRTNVASGTRLTFTPTDLAWLRTRIKQAVNITITADDGNGGVKTVNYPITRTTPAIDLALKTPFETDVAARRLLLRLEGNIPADAVVSVHACNNAFDASPTWEDAGLVLRGFPYPFNNKVKTAAKWGVSFKVRIERGGSTQQIYIDGIGGAFD